MHPSRTLATALRVLTQLRHDPRTIMLLLGVPCLLMGLLRWLLDERPGQLDALGAPCSPCSPSSRCSW